jgi:hypothetical protein
VPLTSVLPLPRALALVSVLFVLASLLPLGAASGAESPTAQCVPAYENAQLLRQRGKLVAAREQAGVCAREQCPEVARKDCARWAEELGREVPSVVVVVRDEADRDVPSARLFVDGAPRLDAASGRAFELDPGSHVFRVEQASQAAVERSFTVYQGERDRVLRVMVPSRTASVAPPVAPAPLATQTPRPPPPAVTAATQAVHPSYVAAATVAGFSVATLAVSAVLGLTGRQQLSDLRSSCAPTCTDAQVDPVRTRLTASDVTLGAGLVGSAVAVYLFAHTASRRASPGPSARIEIAPMRDGAAAVIRGSF